MKKIIIIILLVKFNFLYSQTGVNREAEFVGGQEALNKYLEENLIYPEKAKKDSIEGSFGVFVSIDDKGVATFHDFENYMTNCDECKMEALRLIKKMPKWNPKLINGKPTDGSAIVHVIFEFKKGNVKPWVMENIGGEISEVIVVGNNNGALSSEEAPLLIVEQAPSFPGGEKELNEFVKKNIIYPQKEYNEGIYGTCYVSFVVDKTGILRDIKVMKGITNGESCDREAERVVKSMPKWIPGEQNGKKVNVQFYLPIKFELKK